MPNWSVTKEMSKVKLTKVFSGGACNVLNAKGVLLRNQERDKINDWLTEQNIIFYDPQIHPDTHGEAYDYPKHSVLEISARNAAKINLFEISPHTFCGITSYEIAIDHIRMAEPTVIYFSDGHQADTTPAHTPQGHPIFQPKGIYDNEAAMHAHYREFRKNGNHLRRYLMQLAHSLNTLTITFGPNRHRNDIIINPDRMQAAELFSAVLQAAKGERIVLNFSEDPETRDDNGNPRFVLPDNPPYAEMQAFLDQYVDEGNALRRAISELVEINVFTRVVYTQRSAIIGLEELLKLKQLI